VLELERVSELESVRARESVKRKRVIELERMSRVTVSELKECQSKRVSE